MAWCMDYRGCCKKCGLSYCGLTCLGCSNKTNATGDNPEDEGRRQMKNWLCYAFNAAEKLPNIEDVVKQEDLATEKYDYAEEDGATNDGLLCLKAIKCAPGNCAPGSGREKTSKHRRSSPNNVQLRSHTRGSKRCIFPECQEDASHQLRPRGSHSSSGSAKKSATKKQTKTQPKQNAGSDVEETSFVKAPLKTALKALSCPAPCLKNQDSLPERKTKSFDSGSDRSASPQRKVAARRRTVRKSKSAARKTARRSSRRGAKRGQAKKGRSKRAAGGTKAAACAKKSSRGRKSGKTGARSCRTTPSRSRSPVKRDRSESQETTRAASDTIPPHRSPKRVTSDEKKSKFCGNPLSPWMRSCGNGHTA